MPTHDYKAALQVLTEMEKNRIVCLYLSSDTAAIGALFDWERATAAFGSASVQSMKVSLNNLLKKVGSVKEGADPSPATGKPKGGKKRKASKGGDEDDAEPAPKKRGGGRKKKAASEAPVEDDAQKEEAGKVEPEADSADA
ncbi:hypothetical protein B0A54_12558 [Friedmanniomyces endolithicus]|uniref:Uncharacterized protein n=1 Tax=Friedmanniomyces endolithicus TaxID=329885 RepID=A0A4U0UI18_9PEZI|nr:hypothetical protein LTS09_001590 [Friedmanniomyces endolithicus]KAK0304583.1 hypothetical protein LTR01_007376 [Friedmanniomyces endolithicus]KAK0826727.1 hypothetical protein LTR73_006061 [Friedmanniomyces endolithicus]TKA35283.1 hypothetical protein B0A54_12558 [Friedmanniomyces endolithicus]